MTGETQFQQLLTRAQAGESGAAQEVFGQLYDELRVLAGRVFRSQRPQHTLQATALVHEAFLKMVKPEEGAPWQNRAHFFGVAARAMRQILVNHARDKAALKRGGPDRGQRVTLADVAGAAGGAALDVLDLDQELQELERLDARQASIAELRFFAGLTNQETAEVLGVSLRTVELDWRMAKSWLAQRLAPGRTEWRQE